MGNVKKKEKNKLEIQDSINLTIKFNKNQTPKTQNPKPKC